jgi:hypothetical protein
MIWQMKILEWLRKTGNWMLTMLGLLALWGATAFSLWSALEARRTADTIAKIEQERLNYEKNKYTSEIIYRDAEFVAKSHAILPCAQALNALDENAELRPLLEEPSLFKYDPDNKKHTALLVCLEADVARDITENKDLTVDQRRKIRGLIIDWANQLDAVMAAFMYAVTNQYMLCHNLAAFTIRTAPTPTKLLFVKIKRMQIWLGLPNLWAFMDKYPEPPGCEDFLGKSPETGPLTTAAVTSQK